MSIATMKRELSPMGTWDFGIFDDDVAMDLKGEFEDALESGLSVCAATERILENDAYDTDDFDDGPVIWLALAALQLEHGELEDSVRDHALAVIDQEQDRERWEESGGWEERKKVLMDFREKLIGK